MDDKRHRSVADIQQEDSPCFGFQHLLPYFRWRDRPPSGFHPHTLKTRAEQAHVPSKHAWRRATSAAPSEPATSIATMKWRGEDAAEFLGSPRIAPVVCLSG
jgi:hypothetical protein